MSTAMSEPAAADAAPADGGRWRYLRWSRRPAARKHAAAGTRAKPNFNLTLRKWHRRAGLFAFLFMGWLGVSGILLNQSVSLGLDARRVSWSWLMSLYNLHAEVPQNGWSAGGHWLTAAAQATLLDGKPVEPNIYSPLGMVVGVSAGEPTLFVATASSLVLLTPQGERIDELNPPALPVSTVQRIGLLEGSAAQIVIEGASLYTSADGERWRPLVPDAPVRWAGTQPLPPELHDSAEAYSRPTMALEQVLIDAHSGRLFGAYGSWFVNLVGFAAIALAISGVWIIWRSNRTRVAPHR